MLTMATESAASPCLDGDRQFATGSAPSSLSLPLHGSGRKRESESRREGSGEESAALTVDEVDNFGLDGLNLSLGLNMDNTNTDADADKTGDAAETTAAVRAQQKGRQRMAMNSKKGGGGSAADSASTATTATTLTSLSGLPHPHPTSTAKQHGSVRRATSLDSFAQAQLNHQNNLQNMHLLHQQQQQYTGNMPVAHHSHLHQIFFHQQQNQFRPQPPYHMQMLPSIQQQMMFMPPPQPQLPLFNHYGAYPFPYQPQLHTLPQNLQYLQNHPQTQFYHQANRFSSMPNSHGRVRRSNSRPSLTGATTRAATSSGSTPSKASAVFHPNATPFVPEALSATPNALSAETPPRTVVSPGSGLDGDDSVGGTSGGDNTLNDEEVAEQSASPLKGGLTPPVATVTELSESFAPVMNTTDSAVSQNSLDETRRTTSQDESPGSTLATSASSVAVNEGPPGRIVTSRQSFATLPAAWKQHQHHMQISTLYQAQQSLYNHQHTHSLTQPFPSQLQSPTIYESPSLPLTGIPASTPFQHLSASNPFGVPLMLSMATQQHQQLHSGTGWFAGTGGDHLQLSPGASSANGGDASAAGKRKKNPRRGKKRRGQRKAAAEAAAAAVAAVTLSGAASPLPTVESFVSPQVDSIPSSIDLLLPSPVDTRFEDHGSSNSWEISVSSAGVGMTLSVADEAIEDGPPALSLSSPARKEELSLNFGNKTTIAPASISVKREVHALPPKPVVPLQPVTSKCVSKQSRAGVAEIERVSDIPVSGLVSGSDDVHTPVVKRIVKAFSVTRSNISAPEGPYARLGDLFSLVKARVAESASAGTVAYDVDMVNAVVLDTFGFSKSVDEGPWQLLSKLGSDCFAVGTASSDNRRHLLLPSSMFPRIQSILFKAIRKRVGTAFGLPIFHEVEDSPLPPSPIVADSPRTYASAAAINSKIVSNQTVPKSATIELNSLTFTDVIGIKLQSLEDYVALNKALEKHKRELKRVERDASDSASMQQQLMDARTMVSKAVSKATVFLSLDVEAYERDQSKILEIGWTIFNPKATGNGLIGKHFILEENSNLKNGRYVPDHRNDFKFGDTEVECLDYVISLLKVDLNIDDANAVGAGAVLVGHAVSGDIEWLKKCGVEVVALNGLHSEGFEIVEEGRKEDIRSSFTRSRHYVFDTAELDCALHGRLKAQKFSVKAMCLSLGIIDEESNVPFHNAGNDAYLTMQAFLKMASVSSQLSTSLL
ncbi:hypothetical protein BC830DRAFT_1134388 [Chytriomyces sp. MP71]|nr:hypothetical protein BC830DRAFT_1134388 [Chytriomyces sp. MP71]